MITREENKLVAARRGEFFMDLSLKNILLATIGSLAVT